MTKKVFQKNIFPLVLILGFSCAKEHHWKETKIEKICITDMAWAVNKFLAVGNNMFYESYVESSSDGATWDQQSLPIMNVNRIKFINSQFIVSFNKYDPNKMSFLISSDGITWTQVPGNVDLNYFTDFTWDGNQYIAAGEKGFVSTSPDLTNWTKHALPDATLLFSQIFYLHNAYFSFGQTVTTNTASDGTTYKTSSDSGVYVSSDGINWTENLFFKGKNISSINYGNQEFVASAAAGIIFISKDGQKWKDHSILLGPDIISIDWNGIDYIATIENKGNLEIWNTNDFGLYTSYVYYTAPSSIFPSDDYTYKFTGNTRGGGTSVIAGNSSNGVYSDCNSFILNSN